MMARDFFRDIPQEARLKGGLPIGPGLSQLETEALVRRMEKKNRIPDTTLLGAGCYHHYIPSAVPAITGRSEFYTAYTPYQPEISQGLLQGIFEFQTMVSRLTGMDAANASLYDGAAALAEGAIMACLITGKNKILMSRTIHPQYRETVKTYCRARSIAVQEVLNDTSTGQISVRDLEDKLDSETAAFLVQSPNFLGIIEDLESLSPVVQNKKALLVSAFTEALSLGILKAPGALGADISVGEGQSLGIPPSFGGPHLGIMACKERYIRKLPGRIVGMAKDRKGQSGFVLTLQAREQHIRREKAASNVCSNQALCALAATVYMASLGGSGLREMAQVNYQRAHFLAGKLSGLPGFSLPLEGPFFNEFLVHCENPEEVNRKLRQRGIQGGYPLEKDYPELKGSLLFCVTEMINREDMDTVLEVLS